MIIIPTLLFIIFVLSVYLFNKFRIYLSFMTFGLGLTIILNDWNNTVVEDSTTRLISLLSFMLYSMMVMYMIYSTEEEV